jgi:exopolysaccharide/PEP-CTERM locus tyrosine autokinase
MSIIERAGKRLDSQPSKSLVELAADRLGAPALGPMIAEGARPADARKPLTPAPPKDSARETQPQITIDFDRLRSLGFALPADQSAIAEEFRLIKRPLLNIALSNTLPPRENRNVIMVTSAVPNEGKTFVATNLAMSMASEHGVYVLLVDADVAKPSIPRVFGFEAETGLVDVVADDTIDVADVLIRTNVENLTVLPAGRSRPGMSELLASARMATFVNDLSRRYSNRIIIFDSPPVLARSEPIVLAKHVGQVVLVVEAERTSRTAIDSALALLGPDRVGGVVLNKAPHVIGNEGFGQGYYGYYGT